MSNSGFRSFIERTNMKSVPLPLAAIFFSLIIVRARRAMASFALPGSATGVIISSNMSTNTHLSVFPYNYTTLLLSLQPVRTLGTLSGKHVNALESTTSLTVIFAKLGVYFKLKVTKILLLTTSYFRNIFCSVVCLHKGVSVKWDEGEGGPLFLKCM